MRHPFLLIGIDLALAGLLMWTVRRLWRPLGDRYSRMVYGFGVRGFGLVWGALMVVDKARVSGDGAAAVATSVLVTLPIALWTGYWWGRGMAWFYGLEKPGAA